MKFIATSDTHGFHRQLTLPKGDAIIHTGDFCTMGKEEQLHDFLDWYKSLDFKFKLLIGGNHDFFAAEQPEGFEALLIDSGITYLNDSGTQIEGIKIWGSPVQPDLVGWAFGKPRGEAMKPHWDLVPDDVTLLMTHTPPYGILDKSSAGTMLGCEELRKRVVDLSAMRVHVFGHVHAGHGELRVAGTRFINAACMGVDRVLVDRAVGFEL